jgi:hypothetical protein
VPSYCPHFDISARSQIVGQDDMRFSLYRSDRSLFDLDAEISQRQKVEGGIEFGSRNHPRIRAPRENVTLEEYRGVLFLGMFLLLKTTYPPLSLVTSLVTGFGNISLACLAAGLACVYRAY